MAVMDYRTQDGLADYGFSIEFQSDEGWRVYIIFQPFHQGHDDSSDLPYQSFDHNGRRYVNWSSKLDNLGDARTVAALWAELIHRYQRTQEQNAFLTKLIQRCRRTEGQRRATQAGPDRPGDEVGAGGAGSGQQYRGPVTPHPRAPAKPLSAPERSSGL